MQFVDTHCHMQFADYQLDADESIQNAVAAGVSKMIAVGCTLSDSKLSVQFAQERENIWASIGLHPHEAKDYVNSSAKLQSFRNLLDHSNKIVAIGECGLDYFYNHSDKEEQKEILRFQLTLAQEYDLPVIFHVRSAFDDFWPILDDFQGIRGVLHSYTDSLSNMQTAVRRGLYIGLNGIMTFSKDPHHKEMAQAVPAKHLLLETDAPFLTPAPERGTICEPKHVVLTASYLSDIRNESLEELARYTTLNAEQLFGLK